MVVVCDSFKQPKIQAGLERRPLWTNNFARFSPRKLAEALDPAKEICAIPKRTGSGSNAARVARQFHKVMPEKTQYQPMVEEKDFLHAAE
jgi:hypothetical protein